ncbi:MAG: hypothetical protein Q7R76_07170 [Candidatus Woesearchaeota archaeon]|nr:hypothetical protein [Candidatus Woesearchaeota archaeon]
METALEHMHEDVEEIKRDMAVIKHILLQEGTLNNTTKKMLAEARATPDTEYISHEELKKRIRV